MTSPTLLDDVRVRATGEAEGASLAVTLVGPLPPPFGGISVHLLRLQAHLARNGASVTTIAAGRTLPRVGDFESFVGNSPIRHFQGGLTRLSGVVHVHHRISPLTYLLCASARRQGLPLVLTLHGAPRNPFTRRAGLDTFLARSVRLADHVIAVNTHVAEAIGGLPDRDKISLLPAYIPPSPDAEPGLDDRARAWLLDNDLPLVTFAAYRVLPPVFGEDVYGIDLVARAVESLESARRFRLALLLSVEPGEVRERDYLEARIRRIQAILGNRFATFCGIYAPPILARSALFLRPSLADGDSVAIREALDLGVPVIASDAVARPAGVVLHANGDARALALRWEDGLAGRLDRPARPERGDSVAAEIERIYRTVLVRDRGPLCDP